MADLIHELDAANCNVATSFKVGKPAFVYEDRIDKGDLTSALVTPIETALASRIAIARETFSGYCFDLLHLDHWRARSRTDADGYNKTFCHRFSPV
jgi:hypothetical protein